VGGSGEKEAEKGWAVGQLQLCLRSREKVRDTAVFSLEEETLGEMWVPLVRRDMYSKITPEPLVSKMSEKMATMVPQRFLAHTR
jgi:hypothetical protein